MNQFECDAAALTQYLDGELPPNQVDRVQQHIAECSRCAAEVSALVSMKRSLRAANGHFAPSAEFRRKIQQQVSRKPNGRWNIRLAWAFAAISAALLLCLLWLQRPHRTDPFSEVADLHVGALASANPVDVVSTDRHTVKPWFQGRIPFSFNIPELQGTEFTLLGGRMVYLNQHPGAQLIFTVGQHKISALIFQESSVLAKQMSGDESVERHDGFNAAAWNEQNLRFMVIGDADPRELHSLAEKIKAANQ